MNKLNSRVVLTHDDPIEITSRSKIIDIRADYGNNETEVIACVYHESDQAALSIAKHICMIPDMVGALELFKQMQNHQALDVADLRMLSAKYIDKMNSINKTLYDGEDNTSA